jgi:hypothetical protein
LKQTHNAGEGFEELSGDQNNDAGFGAGDTESGCDGEWREIGICRERAVETADVIGVESVDLIPDFKFPSKARLHGFSIHFNSDQDLIPR